MNGKSMHWVNRLAALGLVLAGLAAVGSAQSVGGQAYSTYVNTPLGSSAQSRAPTARRQMPKAAR